MEARAEARFIRVSPQKARLVIDLIRGQQAGAAINILRSTNKRIAPTVEKVLRSAIANASQKDGFGGDVERLYVNACYANQGPSQKRIRPAPMGRAFRVLKRTAHLTVQVTERPLRIEVAQPVTPEQPGTPKAAQSTGAGEGGPKRPRGAKPKPKAAAKGRAKSASKSGGAKKKTAAKGGRAKKAAKA